MIGASTSPHGPTWLVGIEGGEGANSGAPEDPPAPDEVEAAPASATDAATTTPPAPYIPCTICRTDMVDQGDPAGWMIFTLADPLVWQMDGIEQPWARLEVPARPYLMCPACSGLIVDGKAAALVGRLAGVELRRPSETTALTAMLVARLSAPVPATQWRPRCPTAR